MPRGWKPPEPFVAKGRDGVTDIYGIIFRPRQFRSAKKYPVIEDIYAGPQDSFVPKAFRPHIRMQTLAEPRFHRRADRRHGHLEPLEKISRCLLEEPRRRRFSRPDPVDQGGGGEISVMDLTRVGIYGTSAGGQSALRGLLDHGDFYRAAVADCGCHDNRMDKIWWNEQWMGWPVDPNYARSSNVTDAHKLQGKLLLMVGEMDRNVDPATTMQVVNALIRANKDFELLVMPGAGHGIAETPYGARRLQDFFVRNFLETPAKSASPNAGG